VARWLGPSGVGVLSVLLLLSATGALLVADALSLANIYIGAMRPAERPALLTNSLLVSAAGGAVVAVSGFLIFEAFGIRLGATLLELGLIAVTVPVTAAAKLITALVLAEGRSRAYNVLNVAGQLFLPAFTAVAFALSYTSVLGVVVAYVATAVATCALALVLVRIPPGRPSKSLLAEGVKYGLRGSIGNIFQFLNYRLDFFLVSALRGSSAVGVYSVAVSLAELLWKIPTAAATILFPRVAAGSPGGVAFTARVSRMSLLLTASSAVVLTSVAHPLIQLLFGDKFSGAFIPLVLLMPGVVALSIANILASDLAGRGRPGYSSFAAGITLVVTIGLDVTLIPRYGASGAAVASSAAYAGAGVFLLVVFSRFLSVPVADLLVPRRADFAFLGERLRKGTA
jgi:stage V sporulation protein B